MMSCASLKEVPLLPPSELFQTPQRDPLHVFVSMYVVHVMSNHNIKKLFGNKFGDLATN